MASEHARQLRLTMTEAERRLWSALRARRLQRYKFRRQHPLGRFIADFACIAHRLVIEADGGQHAESRTDIRRTAWLESHGWRVLRFWNNDILANIEGVQIAILQALETQRRPTPSPSHLRWVPPSPAIAGEGYKPKHFSRLRERKRPGAQRREGERSAESE